MGTVRCEQEFGRGRRARESMKLCIVGDDNAGGCEDGRAGSGEAGMALHDAVIGLDPCLANAKFPFGFPVVFSIIR